jgi:hypothetical protein
LSCGDLLEDELQFYFFVGMGCGKVGDTE